MVHDTSKQLRIAQAPDRGGLAGRIRRLRALLAETSQWAANPVSQAVLAEACGVSLRTVTRWEAGKDMSSADARQVLVALDPWLTGVTLDWLLIGRGPEPKVRHPVGISSGSRRARVELTVLLVLRMVADSVGKAVRELLVHNELGVTDAGRRAVGRWLRGSAELLRKDDRGVDTSSLHELANELDPPGGAQ